MKRSIVARTAFLKNSTCTAVTTHGPARTPSGIKQWSVECIKRGTYHGGSHQTKPVAMVSHSGEGTPVVERRRHGSKSQERQRKDQCLRSVRNCTCGCRNYPRAQDTDASIRGS